MIDAATLKAKRAGAGIAGNVLCKKFGMARSRLSDIEQGFVTPSPEELARLSAALDELIEAKAFIDRVAASVGWPAGARRD
jgi:transcriptional regulator with XRE-family HTH domain